MRILLISPHFYPENFKCNDVAFDLAQRGHNVTVLSDIPNYPQGHYYDGYGLFKRRRETINGVRIVRTWVIPRGNASGLRLALNYLSFALSASCRVFFMGLRRRYDAIIVHETSPVTVGIPAVIVKKMQGIPLYFWVLDLWPESLTAAGGVENKTVIGFFTGLTRHIYRNSRRILISSMGFEKSIRDKGDFGHKIHYFPNWADKALAHPPAGFRLPEMPSGFIAMFAGNIGEAQDFDNLAQAALLLKARQDIHFVIVGDGRKREWLERFVAAKGLQSTVHCLGRYPLETMRLFFDKADAMVVSLKDEPIFTLTAPAKLQAYMSAAKPILGMISGEGGRIIHEADCGLCVAAGDATGFAEIVTKMADMPRERREEIGKNGWAYCNEHFKFERQMARLSQWLTEDSALQNHKNNDHKPVD